MILQSLKEYYDRKTELPRYGFEKKEIGYILTLKIDGTPVRLQPTYEGEGRNRRAHSYLVPVSVKRSVGIKANLLWDNPEYALGVILKEKKRSTRKTEKDVAQRVSEQHAAFIKRIDDLGKIDDDGLEAVKLFLKKGNAEKDALLGSVGGSLNELLKEGANLSFKLEGDTDLVVERPDVKAAIQSLIDAPSNADTICLITGEKAPVEQFHTAIKGVWGAQTSGANIVSFNLDAFKSFGKDNGANAPIGKNAAFAYTTALNHLLSRDSRQRMQVGADSTVFWAAKDIEFEQQLPDFFGEPPKDDPDRSVRAVETLFKAAHTGAYLTDNEKTIFYVLGLAPNAARIAIHFWIVSTVAEMATHIRQHFLDIRIVHGPRDMDTLSLFRLLVSTAAQSDSKNIPPNIGGDMMRAILEGLPYPQTLLQAAIRRVRAEQSRKDKNSGKSLPNVTYERAALIKACINRETRHQNSKKEEELQMSLDPNNTNVGYRLGRLFAALERTQIRAFTSGGGKEPNTTIRDRYYGAASGTPVAVFATLIRLSKHHLAKIENVGERVNIEKLFVEIMEGIGDFPTHLCLADQGRFAIGYYHQMHDFKPKSRETN
jgi:CRISPR-associated protein Csd1